MRLKILSLFAVLLLAVACETAPQESSTTSTDSSATTQQQTQQTETMAAQPSGPAPGTQEDLSVNVGDRVFFDYDQFDLKPQSRDTLERQAAWLKKFPQVTITIEGHCDERGTREYNLALGERRAQSMKDYLVSLGIDPGRLTTISYGKERPVALGSDEAAWAQNRRAVAVVN